MSWENPKIKAPGKELEKEAMNRQILRLGFVACRTTFNSDLGRNFAAYLLVFCPLGTGLFNLSMLLH